ncbi:MAG TPA: peptidylprolyl isomerase [Bacteroidales bacterium]|nr:peptidylprolyl isomerase [Bacteroidales bacterium]HSA42937.1 peptidylprolyl isomerase [Bacteroidales bacterium]
MPNFKLFAFLFIHLLWLPSAFSQGKVIDQVVAVVASWSILESDIENQYLQYKLQGNIADVSNIRCRILENLLFQKLMLNQAEIDSVTVTDEQVEEELNRKLRYYIAQFGSEEKFVEFYKKTIIEFKEEFRDVIRDQKLIEQVQYAITRDVKVTPSEVKRFFNQIPGDSVPMMNSEVEIGQIIKNPPVSVEEKIRVKDKLQVLRDRILKGEDFTTLAVLYSEDPGSAGKGGELGFVGRGELYPEFESIAFNLKKDEVSEILETKAGFHIIQLIERRGDYINVRHILLQPKVSDQDLVNARLILEKAARLVKSDSMSFEKAALDFSDDPSKNNGGLMINPETGTTKFEMDEVEPAISFALDKMNVGDISQPLLMRTAEGKQAYRLIYLKSRTVPHYANLKDDYDRIQIWALEDKNMKKIDQWISEKVAKTYINIIEDYLQCPFTHQWMN